MGKRELVFVVRTFCDSAFMSSFPLGTVIVAFPQLFILYSALCMVYREAKETQQLHKSSYISKHSGDNVQTRSIL